MSKKFISRTKDGYKVYLDAMNPEEIRDADAFLNSLQKNIFEFEKELCNKYSASSLEYKYAIGEFLAKQIAENNITSFERLYVFEEIKNWVQTNIETSKDRGSKRQFYDYCYRLYSFGKELVFSFTWRQWSEFLDRSVTTKDVRLLYWIKSRKTKMREDDFRMFLLVINEYLKNHDTSVFEEEELFQKYEQLFCIVDGWNESMNKYFNGNTNNLTKARREKITKYKRKYVSQVMKESKFKNKKELPSICEKVFCSLFVDIDNSANFRKSK